MKVSIEIDMTPEELRRFFGLPDVEGLQQEMLKRAQEQLAESGQTVFNDLVTGAMQPMMAYQKFLENMLTGASTKPADKESS